METGGHSRFQYGPQQGLGCPTVHLGPTQPGSSPGNILIVLEQR